MIHEKKAWNKKSRDTVPFSIWNCKDKKCALFRTMWRSSCRRTSSRARGPPPALRASLSSGSFSPVLRSESTTKIFYIGCFLQEFVEEVLISLKSSVLDPDLDPDTPKPHVFGPPGSGSISQRYGSGSGFGSGSGSFYHQAKIVRKTLIPNVLRLLFDFLIYRWKIM